MSTQGNFITSAPGFALSPMVAAIKALYHIAGGINDFIDDHIEKLKASDNPLIASTGRVLEGAKFGFGLGYATSIAIIAVGQYLLGNPLSAVGTMVTGATLTNPIAMTCAAVGAIYYGWNALTDKERDQIIDRLSDGLAMGIELIRSMVEFVIRKTTDLLTSHQLDEFKEFVKTQAALFGRSLYDVTHKVGDLVAEGAERAGGVLKKGAEMAGDATGHAVDAIGSAAKGAYEAVGKAGEKAGELIHEGADKLLRRRKYSGGIVMVDGVDGIGNFADRPAKRVGASTPQAHVLPSVVHEPAPPSDTEDSPAEMKSTPPKRPD